MTTPVFNKCKSIQAVLFIANRLQKKDFHRIFKILYFADREHLDKYARSITGDTYIAMDFGPVPSNIYDIFKTVRGDGMELPSDESVKTLFLVKNKCYIEPLCQADFEKLSKTDIEELSAAIDKYGSLNWDEIVEKSHDYAWSNTDSNAMISVENILREKDETAEYIKYVTSEIELQKQCL